MKQDMKFRDILDGLANTIAAGEIATDLGDRDKRTHLARPQIGGCPSHDNWINAPVDQCEVGVDPAEPQFWALPPINSVEAIHGNQDRRGFRWAWGQAFYTGMNTILPPNKGQCTRCNHEHEIIAPPSSRHQGGCHILMADGAVIFYYRLHRSR